MATPRHVAEGSRQDPSTLSRAAVATHNIGVIGIGALRILVRVLHVREGGCAVEIKVILFAILAVIALRIGQPEDSLLQDRVLAIPQSEGETKDLFVVADPSKTVFAPSIGPRPRLVLAFTPWWSVSSWRKRELTTGRSSVSAVVC